MWPEKKQQKQKQCKQDQVDNAVINSLVDECNTFILGAASKFCNLLHENNMSIQTVNNCNKQPISLLVFVTMFLQSKAVFYFHFDIFIFENKVGGGKCS